MRFDETNKSHSNQLDFVPRKRRNQSLKLITSFGLIMLMMFIVACTPALQHSLMPTFGIITAIGALGVYVVLQHQANLDLVLSTEFQNLLLSQALVTHTDFCIFMRRDGTLVFANEGIRKIFGIQERGQSQLLEMVFTKGNVTATDRERIMGAIYNNAADRLVLPLTREDGNAHHFVLTIEPFVRPSGYLLIRGRAFREERAGLQIMPQLLRATTPAKLEHLLSTSPVGHYTANALGKIEFVNPLLERVLGFEVGEITGRQMGLASLLYRVDDKVVSADYEITDYIGEAVMQQKSQGVLPCLLYQTLIRDDRGKIIGASGTVITAAITDR